MFKDEYCELEELRKKLLKLGIGYSVIGKKGDKGEKGEKGDKGEPGPVIASSTEGIFFTTFKDSTSSDQLKFDIPWLVPNPTSHFILNENAIEVEPGIYEITFSGLISNVDSTHGGTFFLQTVEGSEIKGLSFQLDAGNIPQMYFSRTILFRFEENTELEVMGYIIGDADTSNVKFTDINLYVKKIHE